MDRNTNGNPFLIPITLQNSCLFYFNDDDRTLEIASEFMQKDKKDILPWTSVTVILHF